MIVRKLARAACLGGISLGALAGSVHAQDITSPNSAPAEDKDGIVVTGSRLKQDPTRSASPLTIITPDVMNQNGITSPEQLNMFLTSSSTGPDNLASNADVVAGAQRGTNGLSTANLRGQGAGATLVLLNGRRVAAHGLSGSAVDVNQIPLAAIERVEVLKDGASAIYGTDAIGGVINYITRKDFKGVSLNGSVDVTAQGGGNIYNLSGMVGFGDLAEQGWNIFAGVGYRWNEVLKGSDRDFVNGNQPNRGLSIDTRGAPIASIFNIGTNAFQTPTGTLLSGLTLAAPNGANAAAGGINPYALPSGPGCTAMSDGLPYDYVLWNTATAYYACAWDTGANVVLQQPIKTLTYYGRATKTLGSSEAYVEVAGSKADSAKRFSEAQLSANTTSLPWAYPLNSMTKSTYDAVFAQLVAAFPAQAAALQARYGRPIAGRWRCLPCGPREYTTESDTFRIAGGVEGPLPMNGWDYRVGASQSRSETSSLLGSGYYFRGTLANGASDPNAPIAPGATTPGIVGVINAGLLNPFSLTQTQAGLDALAAVSAEGTTLFGGKYKTTQADASMTGSLFQLPGGDVQVAVGVDWRRETYEFNGSNAALATAPVIHLAAFDNVNALTPKSRTIKAAYGEVSVPLFDMLTITGAVRVDDYSDFGTTTNPRVTVRFEPAPFVMFRGSYSTGFRVPSFNQIYNGTTVSPTVAGSQIYDPRTCTDGKVSATPGCAAVTPDTLTGGNLGLGPETAKNFNAGIVLRPTQNWVFSADFWSIEVDNVIGTLSIAQLLANYSAFPKRFEHTGSVLTGLDLRTGNFGSRRTKGIDFTGRGSIPVGAGIIGINFDGTLLLDKKEKLAPSLAYVDQVGVFALTGDLGLKWKHNLTLAYSQDGFALALTQIFRNGYQNFGLPNSLNNNNLSITRPDWNARVDSYTVYNLSVSQKINDQFKITAGVKNLLDTDPPFAITYDTNGGSGGSWEPRVADPRGRAFTLQAEVRF